MQVIGGFSIELTREWITSSVPILVPGVVARVTMSARGVAGRARAERRHKKRSERLFDDRTLGE